MKPAVLRSFAALGLLAAGGLAPAAPGTSVFKCTVDGRVTFQQSPCAQQPQAQPLVVPPVNSSDAPRLPAAPTPPVAPPPARESSPAAPVRSALELESEQCLEHLRPMLRDPRSAYVSEPVRRGRVLSLTLHAANPRGGIVTRPAACELFNGRVDAGWTRIHLERLGWFKPRPLLEGRGAALEALRLDLDDIEAPPRDASTDR